MPTSGHCLASRSRRAAQRVDCWPRPPPTPYSWPAGQELGQAGQGGVNLLGLGDSTRMEATILVEFLYWVGIYLRWINCIPKTLSLFLPLHIFYHFIALPSTPLVFLSLPSCWPLKSECPPGKIGGRQKGAIQWIVSIPDICHFGTPPHYFSQ